MRRLVGKLHTRLRGSCNACPIQDKKSVWFSHTTREDFLEHAPIQDARIFYDVAYKMRGCDTRVGSWIFYATCEECSRLLVSGFGLTLRAERFRVLKVLARTSARRDASVSSQVTANRSVRTSWWLVAIVRKITKPFPRPTRY